MPVQVHFYDAGRTFFNDENLIGTYNEDAAKLAWSRTVEFLRSALARELGLVQIAGAKLGAESVHLLRWPRLADLSSGQSPGSAR